VDAAATAPHDLLLEAMHTPLNALFVVIFGVLIPLIGLVDPKTCGHYLGGYRMATFHFSGNETQHIFLVKRSRIASLHDDAPTPLARLLRRRSSDAGPQLCDDKEFLSLMLTNDGFDVLKTLEQSIGQIRKKLSDVCEDWESEYVCVPMAWLNYNGLLLSTKWDESISAVSKVFVGLLKEQLEPKQGELLVLRVDGVAVMSNHKQWMLMDLSSKTHEYVTGETLVPWG